ncbi:UDP-GlcNAc3NAcA epimerase [Neisseria sp. HSC-16F19]|nr:UDP-N-acetylglucosamine 2-epimerase (non-hydrolyzing) [Neisseria sp. HSC-16F19]MCP2041413.1 UDP-GlcNAc3NAcA epimerase [Neisseria sp. HSC-16F19]
MKILTVIGARPQFIKASVVSKALREVDIQEVLLHTGQHFDQNMSDVFFEQLSIPRPNHLLDINGGSHGEMTGRMLREIERVLLKEQPDRVLVYGDTNSTLAGALAAVKLHIPVAHVEAGLRSFNMKMPEEINRILTDQISDFLFCPTETAIKNLKNECFDNKPCKIFNVGDVMQDSALFFAQRAIKPVSLENRDNFILATLHRAENTDSPTRLAAIVSALNDIHRHIAAVVLPLHPRTKKVITQHGLRLDVEVIDPVGYFEMLWLLQRSSIVLTDSGGVQKEAFFFGKYCATMREQTEWIELIDNGVNTLVGADAVRIVETVLQHNGQRIEDNASLYGGGKAAMRIAQILSNIS